MWKKFIVADETIYFGDFDGAHRDIASREKISFSSVRGGGYADCSCKLIWGSSSQFGVYDSEKVKKLLPDWDVLSEGERYASALQAKSWGAIGESISCAGIVYKEHSDGLEILRYVPLPTEAG